MTRSAAGSLETDARRPRPYVTIDELLRRLDQSGEEIVERVNALHSRLSKLLRPEEESKGIDAEHEVTQSDMGNYLSTLLGRNERCIGRLLELDRRLDFTDSTQVVGKSSK